MKSYCIEMKEILTITFSILLSIHIFAQGWSEPKNISNMEGVDRQPEIAVDKNGTIHCVWSHDVSGTNFTKIFYSFSEDDGLTWSEPYDVSQNDDKRMESPRIVADSNNKLYLSYGHNTGNYYKDVIVMQTCEDGVWSDYDTISGGQMGVVRNFLEIDHQNRLYAFWYYGETTYYRYYENGIWSNLYNANIGTGGKPFIMESVADDNNVMHCLFMFYYDGQSNDSAKVAYRKLMPDNTWSSIEILSSPTSNANRSIGIDIDSTDMPHVAYREITPWGPAPQPDTTVYRFKEGDSWSSPEILVTDPLNQKILIDENNKPNVFNSEKLEGDSSMLVHYFKEYAWWESVVVLESMYGVVSYSIENKFDKIYCVLTNPYQDDFFNVDIYFTKTDILTYDYHYPYCKIYDLKLYPNPFKNELNINFNTDRYESVSAKIYDYSGKLIKIILNSKIKPGKHKFSWGGTDNYGRKVSNGNYIIRIKAGRRIVSRPITFIH